MTSRSATLVFWVLIAATPACKGLDVSDADASTASTNDAGYSPHAESDSAATSSTENGDATMQVESRSPLTPVDSGSSPGTTSPVDSGTSGSTSGTSGSASGTSGSASGTSGSSPTPADTGSDAAPYDTSTGPTPGVDASENVDAASDNTDGSAIPLDGGDCTSAIAIPLGGSFSGTTCGGFPAVGESFCQEPGNPVVYFTVDIPDGGSFVIDSNPRASILSFSGCGTSTLECSFDSTSFQFDPQFPQYANLRLFAVTQIDETCGPFTLTVREPGDGGDAGDD